MCSRGMSSSVQSSCSSKHSCSEAHIPSVVGCVTPSAFVARPSTSMCASMDAINWFRWLLPPRKCSLYVTRAICSNRASSRDDLLLAVAIVEKDARRVRQVFGESHPMYEVAIKLPELAQAVLASHDATSDAKKS